MLWVGLLLTFVVLCFHELSLRKTLLLMPLVGIVIMAANVFRAVALFYIEARVLDFPAGSHECAGVIAFILEAVGIISLVFTVRKGFDCWCGPPWPPGVELDLVTRRS